MAPSEVFADLRQGGFGHFGGFSPWHRGPSEDQGLQARVQSRYRDDMASKIAVLACLLLFSITASAGSFDPDPDINYVVVSVCSESPDVSELAEILAGFESQKGADWTLILVDDPSRCEEPRPAQRRSTFRRASITR